MDVILNRITPHCCCWWVRLCSQRTPADDPRVSGQTTAPVTDLSFVDSRMVGMVILHHPGHSNKQSGDLVAARCFVGTTDDNRWQTRRPKRS